MNLFQRGVDAVMREYLTSGVTRFIENRERMQSYLVTRPLPASSNISPPPPPPDAPCVKVGNYCFPLSVSRIFLSRCHTA